MYGSVSVLNVLHILLLTVCDKKQIWLTPIAFRRAKTQWSFGSFECNRVKVYMNEII